MLATLVIGLREGLEAALIVGMIAAFLRRNNKPLTPMWLGVGAAVLLSALVGLVLELVSASLPQAQQEAMEASIGLVAVVIVTFMIAWMSKNARNMKSTLESHASNALRGGSTAALVGMAFLAVLREGVETAVFLVAAFQSSVNPTTAGAGAVIGLLIASIAGYGLYRGGIRLNLAKFFTITGAFLVFVAAGLVMKSLRSAHEAGWLNIGQANTVSLQWLAPNGTPQAAILNGVLGIPSDPRMVEVMGWLLYLVPMMAFILWPKKRRPSAATRPRIQLAGAGILAVAAAALAIVTPLAAATPATAAGTTAIVDASGQAYGQLRLAGSDTVRALSLTSPSGTQTLALKDAGSENHNGIQAHKFTAQAPAGSAAEPATLTIDQLASLNGGRIPVGVSSQQSPGPFTAAWQRVGQIDVWVAGGQILDAANDSAAAVTLTGGGLTTSRTLAVTSGTAWQVSGDAANNAAAKIAAAASTQSELKLWSVYLPVVLAIAAILLALTSWRNRRELRAAVVPSGRTFVPVS